MKTLKITLLLAVICLCFTSLDAKGVTVIDSDNFEISDAEITLTALKHKKKKDLPENG